VGKSADFCAVYHTSDHRDLLNFVGQDAIERTAVNSQQIASRITLFVPANKLFNRNSPVLIALRSRRRRGHCEAGGDGGIAKPEATGLSISLVPASDQPGRVIIVA
jgi:hypothetical protein